MISIGHAVPSKVATEVSSHHGDENFYSDGQSGDNVETSAAKHRGPFMASDRMSADPFQKHLRLGEEAHLRLRFPKGLKLEHLVIDQAQVDEINSKRTVPIEGAEESQEVLVDSDGEPYVKVHPLRLGKVRFSVIGKFADGGIVIESVDSRVEPRSKSPELLTVGPSKSSDSTSRRLRLALDHPGGDFIIPEASYKDLTRSLPIEPTYARYEIYSKNSPEVISLNEKTGQLKPLRVGHALVKTHFGGLTTTTCVLVGQTFETADPEHSGCSDLNQ